MFESITIKNFKSIAETKLKLTKINVFIGPNGAGKSTISQAIILLKQSKDGITWSGDLLNLEGFQNILHNQITEDGNIWIGFSGWYPSADSFEVLETPHVEYSFGIEISKGRLNSISYELKSDFVDIDLHGKILGTTQIEKTLTFGKIRFNLRESLEIPHFLQIRGSSYEPSEMVSDSYEKIQQSITNYLQLFKIQLDNCRLVAATRGFDQSSYQLLDEVQAIQTSKGLTRQSEQAATTMAHQFDILDKITKLAKHVLPETNIMIRNLPQKRIRIVNKDEYGEYGITDEGFGLNQSVYLFMELVMANPNSTLFIDEPEISLHPFSQSKLANVLVDTVLRERKQLIITTHSEHILLGLLEAVMDDRISNSDLNVYYFEKVKGVTKIRQLPVTKSGDLEGGMKGFFEADIQHIDKFIQNIENIEKKQK